MLWFCLLYASLRARLGYAFLWIAMGVVLEIIQGHLGYRSYDVHDMAANTLGVAFGWTLSFAVPAGVARKLR